MESLAYYLIKSSVWLTGFALVYLIFLRNERFFTLNRIYLVSGILVSVIFPFFTWHYTIVLPIFPSVEISDPQVQRIVVPEKSFTAQNALLLLYLSGIIYLMFRIIRQTIPVFRIIKKSETHQYSSAKLIRTAEYPASFSFFSFVFVNPSIDEIETNEIVNHELEHIRQQHWIDLLLFEILRTAQWFNPVTWLYGHLIRQNHEYLADERALQRTSNPAIYRAALLNQMFGGPVISLANSFNYSLNKKRFNMMKQTISSPIRKLKLLLVLPLIAGVFYAFAAPEYKFVQVSSNNEVQSQTTTGKTVTGKVINENGKPLKGASIVVSGKTIGTTTDADGNFKLEMPDDSPIVISYIGFGSQKVNPDFEKEMVISMKTATIGIDLGDDVSASKTRKKEQIDLNESNALVIVDGKEITKAELVKINPDKIESIDVLKNKTAVEKYGVKGKDGVILITLKPDKNPSTTQTFKVKSNAPFKFGNPDGSGNQPLIVKDGFVITSTIANNISPENIESIDVLKGESATRLFGENGKNGVILISTKKGDPGAKNEKSSIAQTVEVHTNSPFKFRNSVGLEKQPMMVVDGVVTENQNVNTISPETIESIDVLKGESATKFYGEKGKNGVILIKTKKEASASQNGTTEVKVTGYANDQKENQSNSGIQIRSTGTSVIESKPLIVIDGVIAENQNMDKIDPETIKEIRVLKGDESTKKYGKKAKNGVIEIMTKSMAASFIVEEMPKFPGGQLALREFISRNVKYPSKALKEGIQGKVFVSFIVSKTGRVEHAKVAKSVDPSLNAEALRVVRLMPDWKPGSQAGENVDVSYTVPVTFNLPNKQDETIKISTVQKNKLIIVPNPANDNVSITLEGSDTQNSLEVSVYDKYGKLLSKETKNGPTFSMSVHKLTTGTYVVVAKDGELQYSGNMAITH